MGVNKRGKERGREYETGKNFRPKRNRLSQNKKGKRLRIRKGRSRWKAHKKELLDYGDEERKENWDELKRSMWEKRNETREVNPRDIL
jgi:hypothetical protein